MIPLDRINAYTAHRMGIMTKEERDARITGYTNLCSDCPPVGYPTDKIRCTTCPRRKSYGGCK